LREKLLEVSGAAGTVGYNGLHSIERFVVHRRRPNVQGYLLELLFPTGWRRTGEVYWRFADAEHAARQAMAETARGARVLPIRICPDAVLELTGEREPNVVAEVPR
jgi:hypothetical protein